MTRRRISYRKKDKTWIFKWSSLKRWHRKRSDPSKSGLILDNRHRLFRETDEDGKVQGNFEDEYNDNEDEDREH